MKYDENSNCIARWSCTASTSTPTSLFYAKSHDASRNAHPQKKFNGMRKLHHHYKYIEWFIIVDDAESENSVYEIFDNCGVQALGDFWRNFLTQVHGESDNAFGMD